MEEGGPAMALHLQVGEFKVEMYTCIAVGDYCSNKKVSDLSTLDGNVLYCHGRNG